MPTRNSLAALAVSLAAFSSVSAADLSWEIEADASYVGDGRFKRGDTRIDGVGQFDTRAHLVLSAQLKDSFILRVGAEWQRYEFDAPGDSALPGSMQALNFIIGADLSFGQAWLFRIEAHPGFAGTTDQIYADSARVPIVIGGSYIHSADLQFMIGIEIVANRRYPVLPGVGLRWKFAEQWVLNAILPAPRLEYAPTKGLLLYAGGEIRGDNFRVNERLDDARGVRDIEGTVFDYWEVRAGGGFAWKARPGLNIELEGGLVPFRELDFHRVDERVRGVDTPGYLRVAVKGSF